MGHQNGHRLEIDARDGKSDVIRLDGSAPGFIRARRALVG